MSQSPRVEAQAIQSNTTPITLEPGKGCLLVAGTTYMYGLSASDSPTVAIHVKWDAAIIITRLTVEESCLPRFLNSGAGGGAPDIIDTSQTKGDWIIWPLPATNVSLISDDGSVGAGTYTPATGILATTGGTGGGAMFHLPDQATPRLRVTVVVGATGGVLRVGEGRKD